MLLLFLYSIRVSCISPIRVLFATAKKQGLDEFRIRKANLPNIQTSENVYAVFVIIHLIPDNSDIFLQLVCEIHHLGFFTFKPRFHQSVCFLDKQLINVA